MKKYLLLLIFCMLFFSCSPLQVEEDAFDNSVSIKFHDNVHYSRLAGELRLITIIFSKELKANKLTTPKLFIKFEGEKGETFEGKSIEIHLDGKIFTLPLLESRFAQNVSQQTSGYTNYSFLGSFTYLDTTRTNTNIIAFDVLLNNDMLEQFLKSSHFMIRFLTKNIDGVSKNVFERGSLKDESIKEFIKYGTYYN
jgi:hypothetical protein